MSTYRIGLLAKREWAEKEVDLTGIPEASPNVYELLPEVREAETKRIQRAKTIAIAL